MVVITLCIMFQIRSYDYVNELLNMCSFTIGFEPSVL